MKRVLFIAFHFPPGGGAGVQRSHAFVRDLPAEGWEPVVLTGPGRALGTWAPSDPSLGAAVDAGLAVERVPGPVPADSAGWHSRAERILRRPTSFARWWRSGIADLGGRQDTIHLVFASMAPYESASAAAAVARRLGVPWVADLRDPWALDEMREYPSGLHRALELRQMRRDLGSAAAIVMNTDEAASLARDRAGFAPDRVFAITNGFDAADFAGPPPSIAEGPLRIVHTGTMHTEFDEHGALRRSLGGLSGALPRTRSHAVLMEGLRSLFARRPDLRSAVEVHLAGLLGPADREVDGLGVIREHGYLTHGESVELLRGADLLFLPMHDLPAGRRASIVPGKTYEYLGSGRPLLAALPDGDARDLLSGIPWADVVRPGDATGMAAVVERAADERRDRGRAPDGDTSLVARFERRRLTTELARVLDAVAG